MTDSQTPDQTPDQTPAGAFTFGGVVAIETTTKTQVQLTAGDRADLARAVTYFSAKPNNAVLSFDMPTEEAAAEYRDKIRKFADDNDLSAGLPKFVGEHMSKPVIDKSTGKITKPAKLIPANKYPKSWNVGTNVTFRLTPHRDDSTKAGPVVTSTVAERTAAAAAAASTSKAGAANAAAAAAKIAGATKATK